MPMSKDAEEAEVTQRIRALICDALPLDTNLTPLPGFKLNLSANPGFRKVFFADRCSCGTSALLSVEVSKERTIPEIWEALPSLVDRLMQQQRQFESMPCDLHLQMRLGPASSRV